MSGVSFKDSLGQLVYPRDFIICTTYDRVKLLQVDKFSKAGNIVCRRVIYSHKEEVLDYTYDQPIGIINGVNSHLFIKIPNAEQWINSLKDGNKVQEA